jgi:hypothetical protein
VGYTSGYPRSIGRPDGASLAVKLFCHVNSSDRYRSLCGGSDAGKPAAKLYWTDSRAGESAVSKGSPWIRSGRAINAALQRQAQALLASRAARRPPSALPGGPGKQGRRAGGHGRGMRRPDPVAPPECNIWGRFHRSGRSRARMCLSKLLRGRRLAPFLVGFGGRRSRDALPCRLCQSTFVLCLGSGHGAASVSTGAEAAQGDGCLSHD